MRTLITTALTLLCPMAAFALEVSSGAGQTEQADISSLKMKMESEKQAMMLLIESLQTSVTRINTCSSDNKFYRPAGAGADANGCTAPAGLSGIQIGQVSNGSGWSAKNINVTFPQAFTNTPRVFISIRSNNGQFNCSSSWESYSVGASNITTTGFTANLSGYPDGCNSNRVTEATWIAVDPTVIPAQ